MRFNNQYRENIKEFSEDLSHRIDSTGTLFGMEKYSKKFCLIEILDFEESDYFFYKAKEDGKFKDISPGKQMAIKDTIRSWKYDIHIDKYIDALVETGIMGLERSLSWNNINKMAEKVGIEEELSPIINLYLK